MFASYDLVLNALAAGLLLGGFYASVTVGISIAFGILDIVNIAHPAFIILGSYVVYYVNSEWGLDPIAASVLVLPLFYVIGAAVYHYLQTEIMRSTQYWRVILGGVILLLVLAFPAGIGGALRRLSKAAD